MNTIPIIASVADLQRRYRTLVETLKQKKEPMIIVNKGEPDIVVMDPESYNSQVRRLRELEEEYLLKVGEEAFREYKAGKTIRLGKKQKLSDLLKDYGG